MPTKLETGKVYVIDKDNKIYPQKGQTVRDVADNGSLLPTDHILMVYNYKGKLWEDDGPYKNPWSYYNTYKEDLIMAESIEVNFEDKTITVKLPDTFDPEVDEFLLGTYAYETGTFELTGEDLKDWESFLEDCNEATENLTIVGVPPFDGTEVTDLMEA